MKIRFHPIHYSALICLVTLIGGLVLAHQANNPWVFAFSVLATPLIGSVGRFEDEEHVGLQAGEPDHDYGDEPRAGFHAQLK